MKTFYGHSHRSLQDEFDSRAVADVLEAVIVHAEIDDESKQFIESRTPTARPCPRRRAS